MPAVGVLFELEHCSTVPGESIFVVGDRPELGNWRATSGRCPPKQLHTGLRVYPRWATLCPVWLELRDEELSNNRLCVQYKFVVATADAESGVLQDLKWESSIANRVVSLPAVHRSVWLITGSEWDSASQCAAPPRLRCVTAREVHHRWRSLIAAEGPSALASQFSLTPEASDTDLEEEEEADEEEAAWWATLASSFSLSHSEEAPGSDSGDEGSEASRNSSPAIFSLRDPSRDRLGRSVPLDNAAQHRGGPGGRQMLARQRSFFRCNGGGGAAAAAAAGSRVASSGSLRTSGSGISAGSASARGSGGAGADDDTAASLSSRQPSLACAGLLDCCTACTPRSGTFHYGSSSGGGVEDVSGGGGGGCSDDKGSGLGDAGAERPEEEQWPSCMAISVALC